MKKLLLAAASMILMVSPTIAHAEQLTEATGPTESQESIFTTTNDSPNTSIKSSTPGSEQIDRAFEKYVDANTKRFNVDLATQNNEDLFIRQVGEQYNWDLDHPNGCMFVGPVTSAYGGLFDVAGWEITNRWGWCGRDRTNGGTPKNAADNVCKNHDQCLEKNGGDYCVCDRDFVDGMLKVKDQFWGEDRIYIEAALRAVPLAHGCPL